MPNPNNKDPLVPRQDNSVFDSIPDELTITNAATGAQTFGDGHYCTHHPDDPAHGPDCYDAEKYFAPQGEAATPSISAAIAEVEKLRDEYEQKWREAVTDDVVRLRAAYINAFDVVLTRLRALQPSATKAGAVAAAEAAALEICDYCGVDQNDSEKVAAIISKHLPDARAEGGDGAMRLFEYEGLNLFRQLVSGENALRVLDVFACNSVEHEAGCKCFWEQCEAWAKTDAALAEKKGE